MTQVSNQVPPAQTSVQKPQPPVNPIVQSTAKQDRVSDNKTIYDASLGSVFWRNFLAGVARALGAILMQILFIVMLGILASIFIWPRVAPLLNTYQTAVNSLEGLQKSTQDAGQFSLDEDAMNQLMNSLGQ